MKQRRAPFAVVLVAAALALVLHQLGSGSLARPPLQSIDTLRAWVEAQGTVLAIASFARLVAFGMALYVLAVSTVACVASFVRWPWLDRVASVATPRSMHTLLGVALVAGVASGAVGATAQRSSPRTQIGTVAPATATMVALPDDAAQPAPSTATMTLLAEPPSADPVEPTPVPTPTPSQPTPLPVAAPTAAPTVAPTTWTVAPGEHLWSIASEVLHDAWGRAPTDREVGRYWSALLDTNRARLVDPDNPDLIRPGQVFVLPTVPAA